MKKLINFIIVLILIVNVNAFIDVGIDVPQEFEVNDVVSFNYTITSSVDTKIRFIPHSECPNAPTSFLREEELELIANKSHNAVYNDILVESLIESQTCIAYIQIIEPTERKIEKTFEIKTNPSFDFGIRLDKKVFVKNEEVIIDYNSEIPDPIIKAILTYPNEKSELITLPYKFKSTQIGIYEIGVTASKEGYKTIIKKDQFGIIEKEAEIDYLKFDETTKEDKSKLWLWILSSMILILIIYSLMKFINKKIIN
tara:strand:+ start:486 stop:1250 length:765 start_codon:yes stop_codon:yes gene_type:complete